MAIRSRVIRTLAHHGLALAFLLSGPSCGAPRTPTDAHPPAPAQVAARGEVLRASEAAPTGEGPLEASGGPFAEYRVEGSRVRLVLPQRIVANDPRHPRRFASELTARSRPIVATTSVGTHEVTLAIWDLRSGRPLRSMQLVTPSTRSWVDETGMVHSSATWPQVIGFSDHDRRVTVATRVSDKSWTRSQEADASMLETWDISAGKRVWTTQGDIESWTADMSLIAVRRGDAVVVIDGATGESRTRFDNLAGARLALLDRTLALALPSGTLPGMHWTLRSTFDGHSVKDLGPHPIDPWATLTRTGDVICVEPGSVDKTRLDLQLATGHAEPRHSRCEGPPIGLAPPGRGVDFGFDLPQHRLLTSTIRLLERLEAARSAIVFDGVGTLNLATGEYRPVAGLSSGTNEAPIGGDDAFDSAMSPDGETFLTPNGRIVRSAKGRLGDKVGWSASALAEAERLSLIRDPRLARLAQPRPLGLGRGPAVGEDGKWFLLRGGFTQRNDGVWRTTLSPVLLPAPEHVDAAGAPLEEAAVLNAASADGATIATVTTHVFPVSPGDAANLSSLSVWDGHTGAVRWSRRSRVCAGPKHGQNPTCVPSNLGRITDIAVSTSGRLVLAATAHREGASAELLDARDGRLICQAVGPMDQVEFSQNEKTFVASGGDQVVVEDAECRDVARFQHEGVVGSGLLADRFAVSGGRDGSIRIWDLDKKQEALRLVWWDDGTWLAADPEGRFDTSRVENLGDVYWSMPDEPLTTVPLEAFSRHYFTPGLVGRILGRAPLEPVPDLKGLNVLQPEVRIMSAQPSGDGSYTVKVRVRDRVEKDSAGTLLRSACPRDLRLFRGGKLVGRQPSELGSSSEVTFTGIRLPRGLVETELSAYAFNDFGVKSETARFALKAPAASPPEAKPRAFLVHIGENAYVDPKWNLDYAVADATLLGDKLAESLSSSFDVRSVRLLSTRVDGMSGSRSQMIAALRMLADGSGDRSLLAGVAGAETLDVATPDDLVVVTFSGHGASGANGRFNLLLSDYAGADVDQGPPGALSDVDLALEMAPIDAGEHVLIIDACQSALAVDAGGFKPGPLGSKGLGQVAYDKRMRVLAATQSSDVALESASIGHGLLTYALGIEAFEGSAADENRDGQVFLDEWLRYGAARVPSLAAAVGDGDFGSRGVKRVTVRAHGALVSQTPRLFDYAGAASRVVLLGETR